MFRKITRKMGKVFSCLESKESIGDKLPLRRKLVIVGDGECGKTCLVTRMSTGQFVDIGYLPTVFDTEVVSVNTGKEDVDLTIFDTAGQEDYDRLRPFSYHDVDVAIVCFSLADTDTLTNVSEKWSPEVRYFCGNIPIILVGNKKDLRDSPDIISTSPPTPLSLSEHSFDEDNKSRDLETNTNTSFDMIDHHDDDDGDSDDDNNNNSNKGVTSEENPSCAIETDNRISMLLNASHHASRAHFHVQAPVKHSEGALMAKRIGAIAYFETSALSGDNVEELLLATTKASILGSKKSKTFKPFLGTLKSWKSVSKLETSLKKGY